MKTDTKKSAYTLVELLVVCSIIALMTVFTVPLFSRYGIRSELNLRSIEIKSLIQQANNMAKNPEQNVSRYVIGFNTTNNTVGLYKTSDNSANLIKELKMPSDFTIRANGADSTERAKSYLVFVSPSGSCCRVSNSTDSCTSSQQVSNTSFFDLAVADDSSQVQTFILNSDPFRIN